MFIATSGILIWASRDLEESYRLVAIVFVIIFSLLMVGGFAFIFFGKVKVRNQNRRLLDRQVKSSNVQPAKTIISIEQLQGGTICTGDHYVVYKKETDLDLQIGGLVDDKMRFSIISSGEGKFVIDRLYVKLHGYADCHLRDEVSVIAAFMAIPAYVIYLTPEFSEYDLIPLDLPGNLGTWRYIGQDFDEFFIRFVFRPYTLFIISVQVEARDVETNRRISLSSGLYKLIKVARGNYGGCLDLERWYTPELLKQPKQQTYRGNLDTLVYQILICDLERNPSYLRNIGYDTLLHILPAIEAAVTDHPDNPVFRSNLQMVKEFLNKSASMEGT